MWQESLQTFLESFTPCRDLAGSTDQFSTLEIATMLRDHTGEEIVMADVAKTLSDRGFVYVRTGDLSLEWLMSKVSAH